MPNRQRTRTDAHAAGAPAASAPPASATAVVAELRRALLAHYDAHKRALPWRDETDPYRILVSEVMLQQTRVETVLDYYGAWLERFPDLTALAAAEVDDVLETWEGLGYYRRARNLHAAARAVREQADGELPSSYEELRELPGLGEYTAGAVASIAFGEAVPAPDGNVRRVLARLFDVADPKPAWLRETAAALVDRARPGDWNQALMELGATICSPRGPACGRCPVAEWCAARAAGTQAERPEPKARRAPRRALLAVAVVARDGHVLLERRPDDGLLGGLWAFPEAEVSDGAEAPEAATVIAESRGAAGLGEAQALPSCDHRFTHIHATYLPYLVDAAPAPEDAADTPAAAAAGPEPAPDTLWVDLASPVDVALPVAQRRILESVKDHLGSHAT